MGKESTDGEVHEGAEASCGEVVRAVRSQRGVGDQRAGVSVPADAGALASGMGRGRPRRRRLAWRRARGTLHARAETRGGRSLPAAREVRGAHDPRAGLSVQGAVGALGRRAGAGPTPDQAGSRGCEDASQGGGRICLGLQDESAGRRGAGGQCRCRAKLEAQDACGRRQGACDGRRRGQGRNAEVPRGPAPR